MDILISFSTSVGVINAAYIDKNIAVDIVNQSIVQWLKNKKIDNPGQPNRPVNNREVNGRTPPYLGVGKYAYITSRETRYDYSFYRSSWNWYWEDYSGTESGTYHFLTFGSGVYVEGPFFTPPTGSTESRYRVLVSNYTPNASSSASSYSYNNQYLAAPPTYNPDGTIGSGEPPGTMLGGLGNGFQFSSTSVSFGD